MEQLTILKKNKAKWHKKEAQKELSTIIKKMDTLNCQDEENLTNEET